jgi:two-component system alkaline phosphatase synthesis response regulator PhoP
MTGYNLNMTGKILIVEDEFELARVMRDYLEKAGFEAVIVGDGPSAVEHARQQVYDLVLLDLNLPGMDGLDVARKLRSESDIAIIMVTARVEETDRLIGLELGADDYITKPFSPREVVARVRAVLRRTQSAPQEIEVIHAGPFKIDRTRHRVKIDDQVVDLTPIEFDLLAVMASEPGRAFTRGQLLEITQGEAFEGYERTIDAHIKNLRAKIEPDSSQPRYLETVFGVGYRFAEE